MELQVGKRYRILIPTDHKKRNDKLFVGTVIQKTEKFTTFQLKHYRESFLNWDLEKVLIREVS